MITHTDRRPRVLYGPAQGPSTRVQIRVRFGVRFQAQFAGKPDMDPILLLTPVTMACLHISAKRNKKFPCGISLAANRTPNRIAYTPIRTRIARVDGPTHSAPPAAQLKASC
jgi:hypothetical protein